MSDTNAGQQDNSESRITELEAQVAFQEDHLQKLNDELVQQQKRIQALELGLRHYERRLQEMQDGVAETAVENEAPPPHY